MSRCQHLYSVGFLGSFSVYFMSNSFTKYKGGEKKTTPDKFLLCLSEKKERENERKNVAFCLISGESSAFRCFSQLSEARLCGPHIREVNL